MNWKDFDDKDLLERILDDIFKEIDESHKKDGSALVDYRVGLTTAAKIITDYRNKYWNKNLINQ